MTSASEFRAFAGEMIDFVADYIENVRDRPVLPNVQPGYLQHLLPSEAPDKGEKWQDVMADLERVIMPGVTHWVSPHFHAYFPAANSYPAIVADIFISSVTMIGFSWISGPVCTELEMVVMNWLAKWLDLPQTFLFSENSKGGGVIQGTASEATVVAMLAAKAKFLKEHEGVLHEHLVAYASEQSHSSCERAALLCGVKMHHLPLDEEMRVNGNALQAAILEDRAKGLHPFFAVATLGTTSCCVFDLLDEMGDVGNEEKIWLHVDAAYAGNAFVCPEFQPLKKGMEKADSLVINVHKWMLINFDCSAMWVKDATEMTEAFNVDPVYLRHKHQGGSVPDYRHWQIPLGRRMRSLKMWFVMRLYGKEGIQHYIRNHVRLAKLFERLLLKDDRFELFCPSRMGLVCFRLRGKSNDINEELNRNVNAEAKIHVTPSKVNDTFFLRFAVAGRECNDGDVEFAVNTFVRHADQLLAKSNGQNGEV